MGFPPDLKWPGGIKYRAATVDEPCGRSKIAAVKEHLRNGQSTLLKFVADANCHIRNIPAPY
jgi:hypothetical protein